jgi:hypothetical protein
MRQINGHWYGDPIREVLEISGVKIIEYFVWDEIRRYEILEANFSQ